MRKSKRSLVEILALRMKSKDEGMITNSLTLGEIPNLSDGRRIAAPPGLRLAIKVLKRGEKQTKCKPDAK
jgi:hypothetical protein